MLRSITSLFTCSSQPSVVSKTPTLYCPSHPHLHIKIFCLQTNCSSPNICSECKKSHPANHKTAFKNVGSIYNGKFITKYIKYFQENFSSARTKLSYEIIIRNLDNIEKNVIDLFRDLKEEVRERFKVFHSHLGHYTEQVQSSLKNSHLDVQEIRRLVESYKRLKFENISIFTIKIDELPAQIHQDCQRLLADMKSGLSESLKTNLSLSDRNDFSQLKVAESFDTLHGSGLAYAACTYLPQANVLVRKSRGQDRPLAVFDLHTKKVAATLDKIHQGGVDYVIAVKNTNYVVTASTDELIKVHRASPKMKQIKTIRVLRGHIGPILTIKYLPAEKLLLSGGYDGVIRIWNLQTIGDFRSSKMCILD